MCLVAGVSFSCVRERTPALKAPGASERELSQMEKMILNPARDVNIRQKAESAEKRREEP